MGSFKIQLLKSADRDIRKIDKHQVKRILAAIRVLSDEPFPIQLAGGVLMALRPPRMVTLRALFPLSKGGQGVVLFQPKLLRNTTP